MESLMQFTYENVSYDFHNFYHCFQIFFEKEKIILQLRHLNKNEGVKITFNEVLLERLEFNIDSSSSNGFTIDQLYRGRCAKDNELIEISETGKFYVYLDFLEGLNFEFWCVSMLVENSTSGTSGDTT